LQQQQPTAYYIQHDFTRKLQSLSIGIQRTIDRIDRVRVVLDRHANLVIALTAQSLPKALNGENLVLHRHRELITRQLSI
jgi:hypothetical protein